jgi:diguanylate cyclase (GGDEF)-like protein
MIENIEDDNKYLLSYFDLDNFKAFNDVYGFRKGDRVIQLFADILRKNLPQTFFKAHIGGDDFFSAVKIQNESEAELITHIESIVKKFSDDAREFYSKEDKENGYIISTDRESNKKRFPLLSVSASVIVINEHTKKRCIENVNKIFSLQKKVAKNDPKHIAISYLL